MNQETKDSLSIQAEAIRELKDNLFIKEISLARQVENLIKELSTSELLEVFHLISGTDCAVSVFEYYLTKKQQL